MLSEAEKAAIIKLIEKCDDPAELEKVWAAVVERLAQMWESDP